MNEILNPSVVNTYPKPTVKNYREFKQPNEVLFRIKRGLAGYISYLAASEMNESFSEYSLYEPILRIMTAMGFRAHSEVPVDRYPGIVKGDFPRIDVVAFNLPVSLAIEVKWPTEDRPIDVSHELYKFEQIIKLNPGMRCFICLFGIRSLILEENFKILGDDFNQHFKQVGGYVIADFSRTTYGCKMFELNPTLEALASFENPRDESAVVCQ